MESGHHVGENEGSGDNPGSFFSQSSRNSLKGNWGSPAWAQHWLETRVAAGYREFSRSDEVGHKVPVQQGFHWACCSNASCH